MLCFKDDSKTFHRISFLNRRSNETNQQCYEAVFTSLLQLRTKQLNNESFHDGICLQ